MSDETPVAQRLPGCVPGCYCDCHLPSNWMDRPPGHVCRQDGPVVHARWSNRLTRDPNGEWRYRSPNIPGSGFRRWGDDR